MITEKVIEDIIYTTFYYAIPEHDDAYCKLVKKAVSRIMGKIENES